MSELTAERIRAHAERLRLANLGDELESLVARAEESQMGYLEFVDLLLDEEVGVRESRRVTNALMLSSLPHHKRLAEFDFSFQPELDPRKVKDLATLGFVGERANVALLGPPGVGKTMIAVGLAIAACHAPTEATPRRSGLATAWPGAASHRQGSTALRPGTTSSSRPPPTSTMEVDQRWRRRGPDRQNSLSSSPKAIGWPMRSGWSTSAVP
jgi:hypothetical protein